MTDTSTPAAPIADGLFTCPSDEPQLIGGAWAFERAGIGPEDDGAPGISACTVTTR